MPVERRLAITKDLSRNDTGETGGHQAGMLIPRDPDILSFFPKLDPKEFNPRHQLVFRDHLGTKWTFSFIYYNNKFFGGTRNEYRLTCMTPFIRAHNLRAGDKLTLSRDEENRFHVSYGRQNEPETDGRLKLGTSWRIVRL
jgi:Restriction endonuclease EcoRII, N-terminal